MEPRTVVLPPEFGLTKAGTQSGGWWHSAESGDSADGGRIICDLCPRECNMKPGDRGFCFVRKNVDGEMQLTTYGRSTGFCIDPIEKKPLNHFYPGTAVLSFGTAGCNLGCKFCQNWDISKSREVERLSELALPEMIAAAAVETGCRSVAYTYNDPIIWAEYAIDTAAACRAVGVKSVAVTAGYISEAARPTFFHAMDAANIDLKAFTEDFYHKITYSHLAPVLDTLRWLKQESDVWFEITNLIIPDLNDSTDELRQMCDWVLEAVGADVPIHFTAFHPDFRLLDNPRTPHETLIAARDIAMQQGVRFAYVGNVHDVKNQSTWCADCGELLIERDWHQLGQYNLHGARCSKCQSSLPGHFDDEPGTWGRKRQPVRIGNYAAPAAKTADHSHSADRQSPIRVQPLLLPQIETPARETMMQTVDQSPLLTSIQEDAIHKAACEIVVAAVSGRPVRLSDPTISNVANTTVMGAFVTLKRRSRLRGCCGSLGQPMSLLTALRQSGARTATDDHRFPPISASELPFLKLDVTLLFHFEDVAAVGEERIDAVEVGRHGLRISRGQQAGLLLPVVAIENNWNAETFLNQVCRKAGLPVTAWRQSDTHLVRFEGRMLERDIDQDSLATLTSRNPPPATQTEVTTLAKFARSNVVAQLQGAIPGCFPANCSDGTVDGLALQLKFGRENQAVTFSQIQFRNGFPLQTTLLKLTESAAIWLRNNRVNDEVIRQMTAELTLFSDPAMHGTVADVDVRGIDPRSRAIVVSEGQRTAWRFDRDAVTQDLIDAVVQAVQVTMPETAQVISLAAVSSAACIENANVPRPQQGADIRPAAVAGKFYPSAPGALSAIVKRCLGDIPAKKLRAPAVMLPHAGLQYSGHIAGQVLAQVEIPETVIIIGPKHTRHGVDWAIAPHTAWQIPGTTVATDVELCQELAARIDGLELDAAAHRDEHSIEVELALLAQVAPYCKVVGITIGSGNLARCTTFGQQLAAVLEEMAQPPLLIISSDMNHFATDVENRRLDEMALQAMQTLDPAQLFDVVRSNSISMCGLLPAVIVMETLRCLNRLSGIRRMGYATSAEVTDDTSRVVGYAGLMLEE